MSYSDGSGAEEGEVRDVKRRRSSEEDFDDGGYDGPNIRPPQQHSSGRRPGHSSRKTDRYSRHQSNYHSQRPHHSKETGVRHRSNNPLPYSGTSRPSRNNRYDHKRGNEDHHRSRSSDLRNRIHDKKSLHHGRNRNDTDKRHGGTAEQRLNRIISANSEKDASRRDVQVRRQRKEVERQMMEIEHKVKRKRDRSKNRYERKRRKSYEDERKSESEEEDDQDEEEEDEDDQDDEGEEEEETESEESSDVEEVEDESEPELVKKRNKKSKKSTHRPSDEETISSESEELSEEETGSEKSEATPERESVENSEEEEEEEENKEKESKPDQEITSVDNLVQELVEEEVIKEKLPPYLPSIHGCRSAEEFEYLNKIEEGTFGVVYRARVKKTNEIVAMKRLKMEREKEGFPITSLREINTLLIAQHPNVVTVREIVVGSNMDRIFIVMDFVEHDLKSLMETMREKKQVFFPGEVKCLMIQLLRAIAHLHENWILHRDLKSSNLLLSHNGILKVGDFGLAREYGSPLKNYTSVVVTLWYRAPELLLGLKEYTTHIDVWSIGCLFGEFLLMEPLFPGKSDPDEVNRIFKMMGTPSEKNWAGFKKLPIVQKTKFVDYPVSNLRNTFPQYTLSDSGLQLFKKFLTYDPVKRITCEEALGAEYFRESPRPIDPSMFPTWPAKSEQGSNAKKETAPPKPPSGGGAFKQLNEDDDESKLGFNFVARNSAATAPGWNLRF